MIIGSGVDNNQSGLWHFGWVARKVGAWANVFGLEQKQVLRKY